MKNNEDMPRLLVLATLLAMFAAGAFLADHWKEEDAIKHGAAHYDQKTGKFRWNDERKDEGE